MVMVNRMTQTLKTTDLRVIQDRMSVGADPVFTWGEIQKIHCIGTYSIVEYTRGDPAGSRLFHPYVGEKDTCTSCTSLDAALIYAIAYSRLEVNEARWMSQAAEKLLGLHDD